MSFQSLAGVVVALVAVEEDAAEVAAGVPIVLWFIVAVGLVPADAAAGWLVPTLRAAFVAYGALRISPAASGPQAASSPIPPAPSAPAINRRRESPAAF